MSEPNMNKAEPDLQWVGTDRMLAELEKRFKTMIFLASEDLTVDSHVKGFVGAHGGSVSSQLLLMELHRMLLMDGVARGVRWVRE